MHVVIIYVQSALYMKILLVKKYTNKIISLAIKTSKSLPRFRGFEESTC